MEYDEPICAVCGDEFTLDDDCENNHRCHPCAQRMAEETAALHARIANLTRERDEAVSSETHAAWREVKAQRDELAERVERLQVENSELRLARGGKLISSRPIAAGPAYERIAELEAQVAQCEADFAYVAKHSDEIEAERDAAQWKAFASLWLVIGENESWNSYSDKLVDELVAADASTASAIARAAAAERSAVELAEALRDMVSQHGGDETCLRANEDAVSVLADYDAARKTPITTETKDGE